jgi:hypothetical protein
MIDDEDESEEDSIESYGREMSRWEAHGHGWQALTCPRPGIGVMNGSEKDAHGVCVEHTKRQPVTTETMPRDTIGT